MLQNSATRSTTMGKQDNSSEKDTENYVDIADFVMEVERFSKLIEPFAFVLFAVDDVRRWKLPGVSVALWLISLLSCLILTQGAMFVLIAFLVMLIAAACLFQVHTRILDKILPDTRRVNFYASDEENNTLHTVREFRYSLIQMHDFVVKCNEYLAYFYALLKWDYTVPAIIFHAELSVLILSLVVFPRLGGSVSFWSCGSSVATDTVSLLQSQWTFLQNIANGKPCSGVASNTHEAQSTAVNPSESQSKGSSETTSSGDVTDSPDKDEVYDEDLDENTVELDGDHLTRLEPAPSKPGMVARLLELKRRRQQLASENCFTCKVSFSSFLKRRYYCRHCGNHFCNKCCNQKVPRSVFGATSPAAQTETVIVCNTCHELLTKKDKDKVS
ncbi:LOW QUALITY PROTEIN: protrudin-like [Haliotis rubra]|uniref:LOW QUALITY PROTEIN: protrudin-like n=1 Tax=Haliotis rubra TaxID=36100 RepID=UPI001EE5C821|nr:LOW QUALITY PROTEIN: protrudin-like [Haliotis rubra]